MDKPTPSAFPLEDAIKPDCDQLRTDLQAIETRVRNLSVFGLLAGRPMTIQLAGQVGEMDAHRVLAVRALEDARMRIGKILQYARDGVSIFDAPKAP